jgi:hypothetical protein
MSVLVRNLWRVTEPFHQLAYRSPEAVAAYEAIGLQVAPHQYFASRPYEGRRSDLASHTGRRLEWLGN